MPDALYIPGAPSLVRPLKDNLSDPRCSAQHSPLPHRAPHGRSPFTVAPVNRTPAGHPEPRIGRIRRLQPSAFHPKSYYHPSARRAVRSATPSSAAAHMGRPAIALPRLQGVRRGAWRPRWWRAGTTQRRETTLPRRPADGRRRRGSSVLRFCNQSAAPRLAQVVS